MSKFHINKHGVPALCRAQKGNCPYGGESGNENHFDTQEEAQKFLDKRGAEEHGILSGMESLSFSKEELPLIQRASEADGEFVRIHNEDGEVIEGMIYDHGDSFEVNSSDNSFHAVDLSKVTHFEQLTINGLRTKDVANRRKLIEILENNGFYYYNEDDLADVSSLELVNKASGDGYESHTMEVFDDDYDELKRLTEELNIRLPDTVWYD